MVHQPIRGDDVETWIKRQRDKYAEAKYHSEQAAAAYYVLDDLLDDYRLHSDTGVPLLSEEPIQ